VCSAQWKSRVNLLGRNAIVFEYTAWITCENIVHHCYTLVYKLITQIVVSNKDNLKNVTENKYVRTQIWRLSL